MTGSRTTPTDAATPAAGVGATSARASDRDARPVDRRAFERDEVRRFTRRRRARRGWLLGAAGALIALVVFVTVAIVSPIMSVRTIAVEGLQRLDAAEVQAALADLEGRPLAFVTGDDVAARLAGFVLVQSYATRAEPPSTLVVQIVERQAIGALPDGAGFTVFDAAGVPLWSDAGAPVDVPVLDLAGGDTASPAFQGAAQVSLALPSSFRASVGTVAARSTDDVSLTLRTGQRVVWGSAENSGRKVEVLLALMTATAAEPPAEYDVSSPETPVTR